MLITVIVPVYNGEKFIKKVYRSLKKQTYKNLEIIFFNDCSKDNTADILKELKKQDKRIKVYNAKRNFGPGGAKNEGIKYATGDYILFVDCDDYISQDFIEKLYDSAKENNFPDLVLSDFTKIDDKGNVKYIRKYKNKDIALKQKITSWGKLIKRDFINKNNLYLPNGPVLDDVLFHFSTVLANPTYSYEACAGYYYVENKKSVTHTSLKKFNPEALDIVFDYLIKLKQKRGMSILLCYYAYKCMCWHLLKSGCNVKTDAMKKEYNKAFNFLEKEFPEYSKIKNLKFKGERIIVKLILFNILILRKIHLDWLFFKIYSNINLERFWPNL